MRRLVLLLAILPALALAQDGPTEVAPTERTPTERPPTERTGVLGTVERPLRVPLATDQAAEAPVQDAWSDLTGKLLELEDQLIEQLDQASVDLGLVRSVRADVDRDDEAREAD